MKKILIVSSLVALCSSVRAQDTLNPFTDRQFVFEVLNTCAIVLVMYLISTFILRLVKQSMDFRLRSKIVDKQPAENLVVHLVEPDKKKDSLKPFMQWFFILAGIGAGFTIISLTQPFGLHSLAIMAFCLSGGFIGYYYFAKKSD